MADMDWDQDVVKESKRYTKLNLYVSVVKVILHAIVVGFILQQRSHWTLVLLNLAFLAWKLYEMIIVVLVSLSKYIDLKNCPKILDSMDGFWADIYYMLVSNLYFMLW